MSTFTTHIQPASSTPTPSSKNFSDYAVTSPWHGMKALTIATFLRHVLNPYNMGFALLMPIVMYSIFGLGMDYSAIPVGKTNYQGETMLNMALYGVILVTASLGTTVALERTSGITRLFATTPLGAAAQITARIISLMMLASVILIAIYGYGFATGVSLDVPTWIQAFLLTLGTSILSSSLGFAAGFAVRNDGAYSLSSMITVLGSFASGLFIPLSQMSDVIANLAPFTPLYGAAQLISGLIHNWEGFEVSSLANFGIWTAIFIAIAIWGIKHDTSR
ncbi:ABC transporter permease [Collinsella sp. zg1085]|uniref:ABC transporter permease n=1 Tax=Collinsella sp. zg1085 TaxID=2844380 RepID=UPI001C0E16CC|nr:ABC transporter permease [Collinsella sp. zg1085]QWT17326.1 ABC transporter permease [Collinsella sp. zg1085]